MVCDTESVCFVSIVCASFWVARTKFPFFFLVSGALDTPIPVPVFACNMAGRTVSTYPLAKGATDGKREGSPICDSFLVQQFREGAVVSCVADGCGWGARNRDAAIKAKVALVDYVVSVESSFQVVLGC